MGLKFLDEPASNQSDATVLELQLRSLTKRVHTGDVAVRSIEDATKNSAAIDRWITSISDLHATKPPPQVTYKNSFPDIDSLMEAWPEEFEAVLDKVALPGPDVDLPLSDYCKSLCAILGIPYYDLNPIESLHVMFTLFMSFKSNPHFMKAGVDGDVADSTNKDEENGNGFRQYGGADVMEINQESNSRK